jgi:SAM-dependent methyltransferase
VSDDGRGLTFGTVAESYDLYRPDSPAEAAAFIGDIDGRSVLDVGAGTGKLTRFLLQRGAKVSVVEPDDEMRRVLMRRSPEVVELLGTAERIPVGDASFDAVLSSSAWHWFTQPEATNEMARVLRDNGALVVMWNGFSRDVAWTEGLTKIRERPEDVNKKPRGWNATFDANGEFVDVRDFSLGWTWPRTIDQVVGLFGTYSGAIIQSDENKAKLEGRVRQLLRDYLGDPTASGDVVVDVPMWLRGTSARRRSR